MIAHRLDMTTDSPALLSKVMDLLLDAVCVVDDAGRYVFVSAACERIFGYKPDELIGRNMIDLVHPEDRERTLEAAAEIMGGDPKTHFENRYVRKDGRIVDIMWTARWSAPDRLRLAVARDVTALKRAERMQRALYRISEAAHGADGLLALYRHIHQIIGDLLPAENFFVAQYDESMEMLSYPYFVDQRESWPEPGVVAADAPIAEVLGSGEARLIRRDAEAVAPDNGKWLDWLGAPLIGKRGVIGAVVMRSYSPSVRYTPDDKSLLEFVSTQVAAAIERKRTETEMLRMARYDGLTDLPNRTLFHDRMEMALRRAKRDKEHLALLYIDLNEFKDVNDTFGHEVGDFVLREVAHRLSASVRDSDTVGRMGGDEFTVLLTNIGGAPCARLVTDKIHAAIARPLELGGRAFSISASIGAAIYPEHGNNREQLFRRADAGMYAVKRARR